MTMSYNYPAGWYPDPSRIGQRYWDGTQWIGPVAPLAHQQPPGIITSGPNHALHAILTLLTFWLFGGWIWVWLIVALMNRKHIQTVDTYGRPMAYYTVVG